MRLVQIVCGLALFSPGLCTGAGTDRSVNLDNWKSHPEVKEVRAIYDEIQSAIKLKKYRTTTRRFNVDSPLCETYPVKSQVLTVDDQNRPRRYWIEQIGSHREGFIVERYYDADGALRFVHVDRTISSVRIYLNRERRVFWAVEQNGDKFTVVDSRDTDWETKPNSAGGARAAFQERQLCPEIKK